MLLCASVTPCASRTETDSKVTSRTVGSIIATKENGSSIGVEAIETERGVIIGRLKMGECPAHA